jgi:hypothetical protein
MLEMMKKQAEHQDNTAELKEAFKIFDRDGNGFIDAEELKKVTPLSSTVGEFSEKNQPRFFCVMRGDAYSTNNYSVRILIERGWEIP